MKIRYLDFIKLNEKKEDLLISLVDIEKLIKNIFDGAKVSSVDTVYEKNEKSDNLNLIITINNLFYNRTNILHTKLIFNIDNDKTKLIDNNFSYLHDINCNFKEVTFSSIDDIDNKLNELLNERRFGEDIKELSDISIRMSTLVNEWLEENDIEDISIYNISYTPIVDNMPCESLSFHFDINVDDSRNIELRFRKISNNEYKLTFKEGDWFHDVSIPNVKAIIKTIGETLKNYIV